MRRAKSALACGALAALVIPTLKVKEACILFENCSPRLIDGFASASRLQPRINRMYVFLLYKAADARLCN